MFIDVLGLPLLRNLAAKVLQVSKLKKHIASRQESLATSTPPMVMIKTKT